MVNHEKPTINRVSEGAEEKSKGKNKNCGHDRKNLIGNWPRKQLYYL